MQFSVRLIRQFINGISQNMQQWTVEALIFHGTQHLLCVSVNDQLKLESWLGMNTLSQNLMKGIEPYL
jgi:hypothetical protein